MKYKLILFLWAVCVPVLMTTLVSGEVYNDRIAAIVNGDVILTSDLKKYRQPIIRRISALPLGIVPPGKWPTEREILDELIVMRLMEQEADRKGITADDKSVDSSIEAVRKRNQMTADQFVLFLAANGVSLSEYRDMLKRQFKLQKLINAEVTQKTPLSEEDAQEYFKRNRGKIEEQYQQLIESLTPAQPPDEEVKPNIPTHRTLLVGGQVRLRQITLKIPSGAKADATAKIMEKAKRIHAEAIAGGDFAQLAKKFSEDQLAQSGGDLGLMKYDDLQPGVQAMVQQMKTGDVTPPIKTSSGIIMFYLADAKGRKEKQVPIPDKIRKQLEQQWKEAREKQSARRDQPKARTDKDEETKKKKDGDKSAGNPDAASKKSLGILTPEEEKEYKKERAKVAAIVRQKRGEQRMKDWIAELKRNSLIEVKI